IVVRIRVVGLVLPVAVIVHILVVEQPVAVVVKVEPIAQPIAVLIRVVLADLAIPVGVGVMAVLHAIAVDVLVGLVGLAVSIDIGVDLVRDAVKVDVVLFLLLLLQSQRRENFGNCRKGTIRVYFGSIRVKTRRRRIETVLAARPVLRFSDKLAGIAWAAGQKQQRSCKDCDGLHRPHGSCPCPKAERTEEGAGWATPTLHPSFP